MTSVGHDSESATTITKCSEAGCYTKTVQYRNVTLGQLKALAEFSSECRQSIKVFSFYYIVL